MERNKGCSEVPSSEGNEARRDGGQEVTEPHGTEEVGEPEPEGTRWRDGGDGNTEPLEGTMTEPLTLDDISPRLQRVAELAREDRSRAFRSLAHHVDVAFLKEAFRRTRKDGAVGVDGQTAADYEGNLEENLRSLLTRCKAGTYQAPPVRRVYIPKGDGSKTRPIGIPTFEDKVLQRAVAMLLGAVYEQDFLDCSYGFRPGRSAHQALEKIWKDLMSVGGGWVVEVDIQGYFDTLGHAHLQSLLDQRVRDGVLRRVITKWLKAGVMEDGRWFRPDSGSPQGGVISPLLANVYLHHVLDTWFQEEVMPRLRGRTSLVRFADDAVIVCEREDDAHRVMKVLPKRFGKYGLTLHPEKTRLVPFRRPEGTMPGGKSGSFDLLGFTHFWARSRKGSWVVRRKTAAGRFTRAVRAVAVWCKVHRHRPIAEQHQELARKLKGHGAYYGITGNASALARFRYEVVRVWRKWLDRRSSKACMKWDRFNRLLQRYPLPVPVAIHSICRRGASP